MREKQIFAVPTFTIAEYFADQRLTLPREAAARERALIDLHRQSSSRSSLPRAFPSLWVRT